MRRSSFVALGSAALGSSLTPARARASNDMNAQQLPDLRFGMAPLPASAPGYDPADDAKALILAGTPSPATQPVPGWQYTGSYATDQRYVVRVPTAWNGNVLVAGTPATRSEFANDAIWGDYALAHGYAFASSNKGIPYNAIAEPVASVTNQAAAYPVPFDAGGLESKNLALRFGILAPHKIPIDRWNDDYRALIVFTRKLLADKHTVPHRVYAVGLSNGGAQVRSLLERHPELVDGGVDWSGVLWRPEASFLDYFPAFLREMPGYVRSGFTDDGVVKRLVALGFPADVTQSDAAHPSLYADYYSNVPPFYSDLTVFAYAMLIDPEATASFASPACTPSAENPKQLPGTCNGTGLALPQNRASYVPSAAARNVIKAFAHEGTIGKPLVSISGTKDPFITPQNNAIAYARLIEDAKHSASHSLFLVEGGTHVDTFAGFGYGIKPQLPFAWAAFERLVRIVEFGAPAHVPTRTVHKPSDIV